MKRERRKCSNGGNKIKKNFKDNVKKKSQEIANNYSYSN